MSNYYDPSRRNLTINCLDFGTEAFARALEAYRPGDIKSILSVSLNLTKSKYKNNISNETISGLDAMLASVENIVQMMEETWCFLESNNRGYLLNLASAGTVSLEAEVGAQIGSIFHPIAGRLIGTVIGGLFGGEKANKQIESHRKYWENLCQTLHESIDDHLNQVIVPLFRNDINRNNLYRDNDEVYSVSTEKIEIFYDFPDNYSRHEVDEQFQLIIEGYEPIELYGMPECSVGRCEGNHILITHDSVSRFHFNIFKQGHDYWIKDMNSSNGTKLNGVNLDRPKKLHHGDVISLSDFIDITCNYSFKRNSIEVSNTRSQIENETILERKPPIIETILEKKQAMGLFDGNNLVFIVESPSKVTLGRNEDADVVIFAGGVSRLHAEITAHPSGTFSVRDVGSSNGTYVNDISAYQNDVKIVDGSIIKFGSLENSFCLLCRVL